MALKYYIPYFLDREKKNFKDKKGNYNIDYRSKGDNHSDATFTCESVPFKELVEGTDLGLNIAPLQIIDIEHPSKDDSKFRAFNFDMIITSLEGLDTALVMFVPEDYLNVSPNPEITVKEYFGQNHFHITFNIENYEGRYGDKTLADLYDTEVKLLPLIGQLMSNKVHLLEEDKNVLVYSQQNSSNVKDMWDTLTTLEERQTKLKDLKTITLVDLTIPVDQTTIEAYRTILTNVNQLFAFDVKDSVSVNITPISTVTKNGENWYFPPSVISPLSDTITNYSLVPPKEAIQPSIVFAPIEQGQGIYLNIELKINRDKNYIFQSLNEHALLKYNLFTNKNYLTPILEGQSAYTVLKNIGITTNKKITIENRTLNSRTVLISRLNDEIELNKQLLPYGITVNFLNDDIFFACLHTHIVSIKIEDYEESRSPWCTNPPSPLVTSSGESLTVVDQVLIYRLSKDNLNKSYIEFLLDASLINSGLVTLSNFTIKELKPNSTFTFKVNNSTYESGVVQFPAGAPQVNKHRRLFKIIKPKITETVRPVVLPEDQLLVMNRSSSDDYLIGYGKDSVRIDGTSLGMISGLSYYYALPYRETEIPYFIEDYLQGVPFRLKILNLNAANTYYLILDVSSDPDESLRISSTVTLANQADLSIAANTLNQSLRKEGIICVPYNMTDLLFFKVSGQSTWLDIKLYNGESLANNPPLVSHTSVVLDYSTSFTNPKLTTAVLFPSQIEENNSLPYYYLEDNNRQPMFLKPDKNFLKSKRTLQVVPGSDSVVYLKFENNLTSLEYNILTVNMPLKELYTSNPLAYYQQLKENIEIALTSAVGSNPELSISLEESSNYYNEIGVTAKAKYSLAFNSLSSKLRQLKLGFINDSKIFEVTTNGKPLPCINYESTPNIFQEFTGINIRQGVSVWLNTREGLE